MATVKAIKGLTSAKPHQTIFIDGLGSAAQNYSSFRTHIIADGVIKSVRNFTSATSSTSVELYDSNAVTSGMVLEVEAWATLNGTEYYIGKSNIARPIFTATKASDPQAPGKFTREFGARNMSNPFNTNYYECIFFNDRGCIEGSTIMPTSFMRVDAPTPTKNPSGKTWSITQWSETATDHPGEQVFGVVKANNGKYYNLGFVIAPSN